MDIWSIVIMVEERVSRQQAIYYMVDVRVFVVGVSGGTLLVVVRKV